jgi:TetR/AcrR family transcriptional regulator, transcriptional repressor for nem operon
MTSLYEPFGPSPAKGAKGPTECPARTQVPLDQFVNATEPAFGVPGQGPDRRDHCGRLFLSDRLSMMSRVGRPKKFERDDVLGVALGLFWERGYHDVSVRELAAAMHINVATLYSEFGDKERLYLEALGRYERENVAYYIGALERVDANLDTIAEVLRDFARFAESGSAPGCLITNSAIELAPDPERSQAALLRYVERLRSAFDNALGDGTSPGGTTARSELSHALTATTLGLFVLIRAKVPAQIVAQVVDVAIKSLPRQSEDLTPTPKDHR